MQMLRYGSVISDLREKILMSWHRLSANHSFAKLLHSTPVYFLNNTSFNFCLFLSHQQSIGTFSHNCRYLLSQYHFGMFWYLMILWRCSLLVPILWEQKSVCFACLRKFWSFKETWDENSFLCHNQGLEKRAMVLDDFRILLALHRSHEDYRSSG